MDKTDLTIHVQIDTGYFISLPEAGNCGEPLVEERGGEWRDHIRIIAVRDHDGCEIAAGDCDSLFLRADKGARIKWIVGEVNPLYLTGASVAMCGMEPGEGWSESLGEIDVLQLSTVSVSLLHGFNAEEQPMGDKWLKATGAAMSSPATEIVSAANGFEVKYVMMIEIIDIADLHHPRVLKYIKIHSAMTVMIGE